jgi:hypothetical protein
VFWLAQRSERAFGNVTGKRNAPGGSLPAISLTWFSKGVYAGKERHVNDGVPFPRRMAVSVLTLGAGLGISLAYGHIGDAIVIAVVMLPGIGVLLLWVYARTKTNAQQRGDA